MKFDLSMPYDKNAIELIKSLPDNSRKWAPEKKCWVIDSSAFYELIGLFRDYWPEFAHDLEHGEHYRAIRQAISNERKQKALNVIESRAGSSDLEFPAPKNLKYLDFQKAGIAYAIKRRNTLFADEMGLGKTIQAIGSINALSNIERVLVICPASLKLNWEKEMDKWLVNNRLTIGVANSDDKFFPQTNVVIINYDIVKKFVEEIHKASWDVLIIDEVHYLKNYSAKRTQLIFGSKSQKAIGADRKFYISGTPILNRPVELYPIVNSLMPKQWGTFVEFAEHFCSPKRTRYAIDYSGAANLDELQTKLRENIMVRRLKKDVLKELPPKTRQIIELPESGCKEIIARERELLSKHQTILSSLNEALVESKVLTSEEEYAEAARKLSKREALIELSEIAKIRHATALAKVPFVLEHIESTLEQVDKLVVFAHHHDVINAIYEEFKNVSLVITGETPQEKRQAIVESFQKDKKYKLFIGSIQASGVGITLTAASRVIFVELDWVPANITQAEDRCHRIGQHDNVLVQHMVLENSLDARMVRLIVEKQEIIDKALNE